MDRVIKLDSAAFACAMSACDQTAADFGERVGGGYEDAIARAAVYAYLAAREEAGFVEMRVSFIQPAICIDLANSHPIMRKILREKKYVQIAEYEKELARSLSEGIISRLAARPK